MNYIKKIRGKKEGQRKKLDLDMTCDLRLAGKKFMFPKEIKGSFPQTECRRRMRT